MKTFNLKSFFVLFIYLLTTTLCAFAAPPPQAPPVTEPVEVYGDVNVKGTVSVDSPISISEPVDVNVQGSVPVDVQNPVDVNVQGILDVQGPNGGPVPVEGDVRISEPVSVNGPIEITSQTPLQVIDVTNGNSSTQPAQFGATKNFHQRLDGVWVSWAKFGPVPEGKIFVIEHVSTRILSEDATEHTGNGRLTGYSLDPATGDDVDYLSQIYFTYKGSPFWSGVVANFGARYYVDENTYVKIGGTLSPQDSDATFQASIIGYYIDK